MSDGVPTASEDCFILRKLLPERRRGEMVLASPGCGCCCCCCLHSAGGLVGAILGSKISDQGDADGQVVQSKQHARRIYWRWMVLSGVLSALFMFAVSTGKGGSGGAEFVGWMVLTLAPAIQLLISLVALISLVFHKFENVGSAPYKQLGKITLYSLAGTVLGGVLMAVVLN